MKTAIEGYNAVPAYMPRTMREIREWMEALPDRSGRRNGCELWSCHALVRAVKIKWKLDFWRVTDGFFARMGQNHSWLTGLMEHNRYPQENVLDVYPVVGMGGPILVDISSYGSPWRDLYIEKRDYYSDDHRAGWQYDADLILAMSRPNDGRR